MANAVWYDNWKDIYELLNPVEEFNVYVVPILFGCVIFILLVDVIAAVIWYVQKKRKLMLGFQAFEAQRSSVTSPIAVVLQICATLKPMLSPNDQLRIEQVMSLLVDGAKVEMENSVFSREDNQYLATLTNLPLQSRDQRTGLTITTTANAPNTTVTGVKKAHGSHTGSSSGKSNSEDGGDRSVEMSSLPGESNSQKGLESDEEAESSRKKRKWGIVGRKKEEDTSDKPFERILAAHGAVLDDWKFDCFEFTKRCHNHPLPVACVYFWKKFELIDDKTVTAERVYAWAQRMEEMYFNNPFHNATHATDVLQSTAWLISRKEVSSWMSRDDILALLFSAVIHDVGHVARRNEFLSVTNSSLAITFNDCSILENNSLALAFRAMMDNDRVNLFLNFSPDRRRAIRKTVIALVRATDMKEHFTLTESFKAKLDLGKFEPSTNADDRLLLQKMILKLSDLAGVMRGYHISKIVAAHLFEEFLQQGDEEKSLGLPVSEYMDRNNTSIDKCEMVFIQTFSIPMMQAYHRYCSSADEPSLLLMDSYEKWKLRAKKAKMGPYKAKL